jgi:hypothetical protein
MANCFAPWSKRYLLIIGCEIAMFSWTALADPTTRPSDQDLATPHAALLAYDHWIVDLRDFDEYATFYHATTDQEKAYVQQCRKFDRVASAIERISRQAFGADNCTAIMHEFGEPDVPDLQSAAIVVNGSTASVHFTAVQADFQMVFVDGGWKVDTANLLKSSGGAVSAMLTYSALTAQLQPVADGLQAGKFKTAQEVIHAIDQATGNPQK